MHNMDKNWTALYSLHSNLGMHAFPSHAMVVAKLVDERDWQWSRQREEAGLRRKRTWHSCCSSSFSI